MDNSVEQFDSTKTSSNGQKSIIKLDPVDSTTSLKYQGSESATVNKTLEKAFKRPLTTTDRTPNNSNCQNDQKKPRLDVIPTSIKSMHKNQRKNASSTFVHGNYDRYYGYRNINDFKDIRLQTFENHRTLFEGCNVLDVGCNNGLVTISVARDLLVKRIVGVDIDKRLVEKARKHLSSEKRNSNADHESFPFNVEFKSGNYVLAHETLLKLDVEQFDTILCLSVTKWIHLRARQVKFHLQTSKHIISTCEY